jgi:hypothetical protein
MENIFSMKNYSYSLTEEVARQAVEVKFKTHGQWSIAFSNPTAGPWKIIKLGNYEFGDDLRYTKEEDRPDLILFTPQKQAYLFFVLEAKDSLHKLLAGEQLAKSMKVFDKETNRLRNVIVSNELAIRAFGEVPPAYKIIPGYVIGTQRSLNYHDLNRLFGAHSILAKAEKNNDLSSSICFIVLRTEDELSIYYTLNGIDELTTQQIKELLPKEMTEIR